MIKKISLSVLLTIGMNAQAEVVALDAFDLTQYRGKVVYLDFWASWCGPCRQSLPWMETLATKFPDEELAVVTVNVDSRVPDFQKFMDRFNPALFIVRDPEGTLAEAYQLPGMPSSFLLDGSGTIVYRHEGFREKDKAVLEQKIRDLVAQQNSRM